MAKSDERPQIAAPRAAQQQLMAQQPWDIDIYHAMEKRDNALIEDEILNGAGSSKFVYNFKIQGKDVSGISVIGARHLASEYGGIKHRMVASIDKRGKLFIFTSYPAENVPMQVHCSIIDELEHDPDFYASLVEIIDVKKGNSIQIERRESRWETRQDGSLYERPHFSTISQSKAYRNGVLALIPQDVQIRWKQEMLKLGKDVLITADVLDEKRAGVLRFAAAKQIPLDRGAVEGLTMDQIAGLADAAREGAAPAFAQSAVALGLINPDTAAQVKDEKPEPAKTTTQTRGRKQADPPAKGAPATPPAETDTSGQPAEATQETQEPPAGATTEAGAPQAGAASQRPAEPTERAAAQAQRPLQFDC